jgi:hypothetical protein
MSFNAIQSTVAKFSMDCGSRLQQSSHPVPLGLSLAAASSD